MKDIDLAAAPTRTEDMLQLAEHDQLVVRTPAGKVFLITEVNGGEEADEAFEQEVALTRANKALRQVLAERSREPGRYSLDEVREKLGLTKS
jgi:hypothetical protein